MPITTEQLHEIRDIIDAYHAAFIVNTVGPEAVSKDTLAKLKAMGLVNIAVESTKDAYLYGQAVAAATDPATTKMSYQEFKEHLRKNPIPLSPIEQRAVDFAKQQAAQFVVGLGNRINTQTGQLLIEADAQLRRETREGIRERVSTNIAQRESVKKLKSDLGWMAKDWTRDWDRIAITEKHTAMQSGVADHFESRYGPDVYVAKRPMPDACKHCKRLHLGPDGQPRIFKLSTLQANGINNFGRKAADWLAVVGSTHPFCQCQMFRVPAGWGFNEEGQMVPGGELGVKYETENELKLALLREHDLQKAFALQGQMSYQGIPIAIENKVGTIRRWQSEEGGGETKMLHAYGYVKRTKGADEDEVDVYIGPAPDAPMAFIIHQQNPKTGMYDEDKVMLGFLSQRQAEAAYRAQYDSPDFAVTTTPMRIEQFRRWVGSTAPATGEMFKARRPVQKMCIPLEKAGAPRELVSSGSPEAFVIAANSPAGGRAPGTGASMANMAAGLERERPASPAPTLMDWYREQQEQSAHMRESVKRDIAEDYKVREPAEKRRYTFVIPESWGTLTPEEIEQRREEIEKLDPHGWRNMSGEKNTVEVGSDERVK